ncbi:MAG: hypothetical protein HYU37_02675 [Acidobacteria bacterium]|nr:hypothetical protein [Acidobacteriota bacterium]
MKDEELRAIRARLEKASDGPWFVRRIPNSYESQAGDRHTHPCVRGFRVPRRLYNLAWQQCEADAEFMAEARQDVPNLLNEVERLRAMLGECQAALEELARQRTVSPEDAAQIAQYLADEQTRWADRPERRPADVRRLYLSQSPLRPKDAIAALSKPRRVG